MKIDVTRVNALAELESFGIEVQPVSENEVRIKCPFHDDSTPSCAVNTKKNVFKCHASGCETTGDVITLLSQFAQVERSTMLVALAERYDIKVERTISADKIEEWHANIWTAGPLLSALRERAVTDDDIRLHRLGYNHGRIVIPVRDDRQRYVNARLYLPGAPGPQKMKNMPGMGKPRLFNASDLQFERIWLCGGEIKAVVASRLLREHKVGAVAITAGEGAWDAGFAKCFHEKSVYVCYDIDKGGIRAAEKVASHLFWAGASDVSIIKLPLDPAEHPKGDINDYAADGATSEDLYALMANAVKWSPGEDLSDAVDDSEFVEVSLSETSRADHTGQRLQTTAVISAIDSTPFIVPQVVGISCTRDQTNCAECPVMPKEPDEKGFVEMTIRGTSQGLLSLIGAPKKLQKDGLRDALRIPRCKVVEFAVRKQMNVTEVRLVPQLNIGQHETDSAIQPAMIVAHGLEPNAPYRFGGRVWPSPKNQQAMFLVDESDHAEDSLTSFAPCEADLNELKIFQPTDWSLAALDAKFDEIYDDLEANVTRIFKRRLLHLALDAAYFSVLLMPFDEQVIKGWTNILVLGDSSQGKSEASQRLLEFYGLGDKVDCKNATVAGLLGGLQNLNGRHFVVWGVIPMHDRGIVVLEEVKGASTEVLSKLTDMRSSGMAEIPKIEKRKAYARTRLVFISNPRSDRPMTAYNFGVEAIRELMGGLEDIRRFDFVGLVSSGDVSIEEINRMSVDRPKVDHRFTAELSKRLVLWAWTRKPENIRFEDGADAMILKGAISLCEDFSEAIPLCDRGTMRHKIARLAAAFATRTFSIDDDVQKLLVRRCHVEFVIRLFEEHYGSESFGYRHFTKAQRFAEQMQDVDLVAKKILTVKFPADFVRSLMYADEITLGDICDWTETDRDEASRMLSFLVRKRALHRKRRAYIKASEFIAMLKKMEVDGLPEIGQIDETVEEF